MEGACVWEEHASKRNTPMGGAGVWEEHAYGGEHAYGRSMHLRGTRLRQEQACGRSTCIWEEHAYGRSMRRRGTRL